ncbi:hypothetical protein GGTG_12706 [Gaeumannomyces tritici R3-111a-1]|uniref:Uncharacterized protein n=1 Tax=Gaeumannomyces tritici (strain R3-111a-1) TaxID=644352 RepID=J3PGS6_GAET3|nr:hypothetical protein GGTG_12706 [Gaeumannomyces tritici R3-111a-1]EJT69823.1 hypothetical protein GGTG_12706 [Gaeumannomyces tritici R3-111a-1]
MMGTIKRGSWGFHAAAAALSPPSLDEIGYAGGAHTAAIQAKGRVASLRVSTSRGHGRWQLDDLVVHRRARANTSVDRLPDDLTEAPISPWFSPSPADVLGKGVVALGEVKTRVSPMLRGLHPLLLFWPADAGMLLAKPSNTRGSLPCGI